MIASMSQPFRVCLAHTLVCVGLFLGSTSVFSQVAPANPSTPAPAPTNRPATTPANQPATTTSPAATQNNQNTTTDQTNTTDATTLEDGSATEGQSDIPLSASAAAALQVEQRQAFLTRIYGYTLFTNGNINVGSGNNIATPNNYVLGTGDELNININNDFGYSTEITGTINRDGEITLPKAGSINIGGLGVGQAKIKIANAMRTFYPGLSATSETGKNTLTVSVGKFRSIKVQILGEVNAPGSYDVSSFTTFFNALYLSGGPNAIGTYRKIQLIRGNRVHATLDVYDILQKGYSTSDILLKDQDVIQVGPYESRMAIEGNVKRAGLFELLPGQRLNDLINYAGNFSETAYTRQVKVFRNTPRERRIIDVKKIDFDTFEMQSGDSVLVEKILSRFENMVVVGGSVYRPGQYSLDSNPTLLKLIESADGFTDDALLGRVLLTRVTDNLAAVSIPVNIADIRSGKMPDIPLQREDNVYVTSVFGLSEQSFVRVQGAVNNPEGINGILVPYASNLTIQDVLLKVGGLKESASLTRVEVARRKRNADPLAIDAEISELFYFTVDPDLSFSNDQPEFPLLPFDEIFVRTSPNYVPQTFARVEGEVLYPDEYSLQRKDEKVSDLIKRAGGLNPFAFVEGATLIRQVQLSEEEIRIRQQTVSEITESGNDNNQSIQAKVISPTEEEAIGIDLKKILQNPGSMEDVTLVDGDVIRVPKRLETVRVQGEVLYPSSIRFNNDKSFMDYISESGGFNKRSLKSLAYVLYPNGSVDRTRRFLFVNIYPRVEPGSEIIVPRKTINTQQKINQTNTLINTITATLTSALTLYGILRLNSRN